MCVVALQTEGYQGKIHFLSRGTDGKIEKAREVATNLKSEGIRIEVIAKTTNLSIEEIENCK